MQLFRVLEEETVPSFEFHPLDPWRSVGNLKPRVDQFIGFKAPGQAHGKRGSLASFVPELFPVFPESMAETPLCNFPSNCPSNYPLIPHIDVWGFCF